jgi:carbon storage regulator
MLILGRKVGEGLSIGENIHLVVASIDNRGARLGISAPRDVPIVRDEIAGRGQLSDLPGVREALYHLASYAASARIANTDEWMAELADRINVACASLGDPDRFGYEAGGIVRMPKQAA